MKKPHNFNRLPILTQLVRLSVLVTIMLGWASTASAFTLDPHTERIALSPTFSYLEDPQGDMDLTAVRAANDQFQPLGQANEPNLGYSASAFWLHTELQQTGDLTETRMLEISFPTLDHVEVFLTHTSDGQLLYHAKTGDQQPFNERPYRHRNFVFPLQLPANETLQLYLRIQSDGSLTMPAYLWSPTAFLQYSRDTYIIFTLYFGILSALFAYNLLLFFSLRDRTYLYYVLFVGAMAVGQGGWNGFFFEYFWPHSPDWGNVAAVAGFDAAGMFGAIFSRTFLSTHKQVPWLDRAIVACAIIFGLLLITLPVVPYQWNAIGTSMTGVMFASLAVIGGVLRLWQGFRSARYFLLAWSLLLFGAAALGARNLGLVPTNFFTLYAMQIGSALEALLLSFALAERINDMRLQKEQAENEAVQTRQKLVDTLAKTEQWLEQQVAERTRKLVDLNNQLLLRQKQLNKLAHYDTLTGLANRTLLEERLVHAIKRAERQRSILAVMLLDLDGFKPINDHFGHTLGDRVLQHIAGKLDQGVRASDTVARIGGDEFVIVLEDVNTSEDVKRIASQLASQIEETIVLDDIQLSVGASIGCALFPDDGEDAQQLLDFADQRMYDRKFQNKTRRLVQPPTKSTRSEKS